MSSTDVPCAATDSRLAPVVTGTDVVECAREFGVEFASRLLAYGEATIVHYNRCTSMQAAAARTASSSGSSGPRSLAQAGAGLTGSRLASIGKVESWRTNGVNSELAGGCRKRFPDGMCALKLFAGNVSPSVLENVGEWPTFGALVRKSAKSFASFEDLEKFRVVSRGQGVAHVAEGGTSGVSFLDAVASYSSRISPPPGTLAFEVKSSGRIPVSGASLITGRTRLGGMLEADRDKCARFATAVFGDRANGWKFIEGAATGTVVRITVKDAKGVSFGIGVVVENMEFQGFTFGYGDTTVWWPLHAPSEVGPVLKAAIDSKLLEVDSVSGSRASLTSGLLGGTSSDAGSVRLIVEAEAFSGLIPVDAVVSYANSFSGAQTRRVVLTEAGKSFLVVMSYPALAGAVDYDRGAAAELLRVPELSGVVLRSVAVSRVFNWMTVGDGDVEDRNLILNVQVDERGRPNPSALASVVQGLSWLQGVVGVEVACLVNVTRAGLVGYLVSLTVTDVDSVVEDAVRSLITGLTVGGSSVRVSSYRV